MFDITPVSLGIEGKRGRFRTLIERNTIIPCQKSLIFSTASDFQSAVTIRLFQGESDLAYRNRLLGQFDLVGIPPAPRGFVQLKIDLEIDSNGILCLSAGDLATGRKQQIRIQIQADGFAKAEQLARDPSANQEISALESAHRLAYVAHHLETDLSARMNSGLSQRLHSALTFLNQALSSQPAAMGAATNQLGRILSEVFLGLELSIPSHPQSKAGETSRANRTGSENRLTGFHTLDVRPGGMGIVTIVLKDGRIFAVKTLRDELLKDPAPIQRFVAEAHTWVGLERHSNIVSALLVREAAGRPYLFLEYADGGNLVQWLGKLPTAQAVDYAIQLCTGMSYAYHKAAIVHRDIKPANILLSKYDRFRFGYAIKVTDFGLAGVWKPAVSDILEMVETQMSRGMGTWPYMPPEQFPGVVQIKYGFHPQPVTVHSDIYSFGVLLYEMFTGIRPFQSTQEIFSISPVAPDRKNKDVSKKLSALTSCQPDG